MDSAPVGAEAVDAGAEYALRLGEPEDLPLEGLAVGTCLGTHRFAVGAGFGTHGLNFAAHPGGAGENQGGQCDGCADGGEGFSAEAAHPEPSGITLRLRAGRG
jgi:hypothetical protein